MNETTKNFLLALANRKPPNHKTLLYRLYYNKDGTPLRYSHEDLPGQFIDLTPEQFHPRSVNVMVKNGKFVRLERKRARKLRPTAHGKPCHPGDITVIVDSSQPHTAWSYHD